MHWQRSAYSYDEFSNLLCQRSVQSCIKLSRRTVRLRPRPLLPPRQILQPGDRKIPKPRSGNGIPTDPKTLHKYIYACGSTREMLKIRQDGKN